MRERIFLILLTQTNLMDAVGFVSKLETLFLFECFTTRKKVVVFSLCVVSICKEGQIKRINITNKYKNILFYYRNVFLVLNHGFSIHLIIFSTKKVIEQTDYSEIKTY